MKYFFIAGEVSGDTHGASLIHAIKELDKQAVFYGMGGDKMKKAGCRLLQDYRLMAYMGVVAVIKNLPQVIRNFRIAKNGLIDAEPDALILIDYPSFNLKIARFAKRHLPKTKVAYYIPPKVWAWKQWRIHSLVKNTDDILTIFPFETAFYNSFNYTVHYVGNPTAEKIQQYLLDKERQEKQEDSTSKKKTNSQQKTIALLPGSRQSEIKNCLPKMLKAACTIENADIIIAATTVMGPQIYQDILSNLSSDIDIKSVSLNFDKTYEILEKADAAIVNSGTATLETALLDCPQVAVYHIAMGYKPLVKLLRPLLFRIPHFTLVNILAGKQVIKELIAYEFSVENLSKELRNLLYDKNYREQMQSDYHKIHSELTSLPASINAASRIMALTNAN